MADGGLSWGIRWSGISMVGREVSRMVFAILLARLIGPEAFGIVAQALVYIGVIGLLLDQGFSSALIQREHVEPDMPGAVVTVNLGVGAAFTLLTIAIAPWWASFMQTPELAVVLATLAPCLIIRAASITPRAMLQRDMEFRRIGIADITAAMAGGAAGLCVALAGGSYWALVVQILITDIVLFVVFLLVGAGRWPNLHFRRLREIAAFSLRAFAAGILINSVSRNIDNLLVGRFHGPQALAFYGLAYRLLLLPVQLASITVGAVLFPVFSRLADDLAALRKELARATRTDATLALPVMTFAAVAAPQLVLVLFGPQWNPAVSIVQVLALAGAMQAIYQPSTAPLMLGLGHATLNLRYAWLTTAVSTAGIVAGLPFGPFGVAAGYSLATAFLVPVEWLIRRRLLAVGLRDQIGLLIPGAHTATWVGATYLLIAIAVPGHELVVLGFGSLAAAAAGGVTLRLAHPAQYAELRHIIGRVLGVEDRPAPVPQQSTRS
ncbi:lipopolysaccharide biosynthesis protein [Rhodococcus sp. NPDC003382]|uniref:lipopolysaccharide biosynthesis protein n=1 Tax=unclassified Rhodococcus (in: high G+C Gram-positive bacteria) TaxID=192944 RepID=UPI001E48225A|nr:MULTISPECIES: lipopolysaccharide biosynthesis protein [unclassified Rhodococcus (in: high G+C Gram-positive bacteria)]MCK8674985.1 lipopolysaccharide biosynthesis protein [Rhodococcus sp. HM1]